MSELTLLRHRLSAEVSFLANSEYRYDEWFRIHHIAPIVRYGHRHETYEIHMQRCIRSLCINLPFIGRRRNNLDRDDVEAYLGQRLQMIDLLQMHVGYFRTIYSQFVAIGNRGLGENRKRGKKVTLGSLLRVFSCLSYPVTDDDLLDVSFHGSIDVSMIHMDRSCMSDLFGLAAALGRMRYSAFRPTVDQAQAFLMAAGEASDLLLCPAWLRPQRRTLANRLVTRFRPIETRQPTPTRERLVELCRAVVHGRPIPDHLQNIQYDILP